ncbi:MAG TPA: zf-HC2 domain-containing protein [Gemmatimonadales bacterium]|nr:zf-HC2 domain-containing protein [Gemmatimonadales bacterium]
MQHVDDGQLNALLDGELKGRERQEVEDHLAACGECRARYAEARQFLEQASDLLGFLDEAPEVTARPVAAAPAAGRRSTVTAKEKAIDIDGATGKVPAITEVPPPAAAPPAQGRRSSITAKEKAIDLDSVTATTAAINIDAPTGKTPAINLDAVTGKTPALPAEPPPAPAPVIRPIFGHGGAARIGVRRLRLDLKTLAWAAGIVLALGVGYFANELTRQPADYTAGGEGATTPALAERPAPPPAAGAAAQPRAVRDTTAARPARARGTTAQRPNETRSERALEEAGALAQRPAVRPAEPERRAASAPAPAAGPPAEVTPRPQAPAAPARALAAPPASDVLGISAAGAERAPATRSVRSREAAAEAPLTTFRATTPDEAILRLSGAIRLIDGMVPRRYEIGPGRLVAGADPNRVVVRVVYTDSAGRRIVLDQQPGNTRPDSANGQARASVNGLMQGDTLMTTERGSSQVRWVDRKNFWLSLSGRVGADTLRALIQRIR